MSPSAPPPNQDLLNQKLHLEIQQIEQDILLKQYDAHINLISKEDKLISERNHTFDRVVFYVIPLTSAFIAIFTAILGEFAGVNYLVTVAKNNKALFFAFIGFCCTCFAYYASTIIVSINAGIAQIQYIMRCYAKRETQFRAQSLPRPYSKYGLNVHLPMLENPERDGFLQEDEDFCNKHNNLTSQIGTLSLYMATKVTDEERDAFKAAITKSNVMEALPNNLLTDKTVLKGFVTEYYSVWRCTKRELLGWNPRKLWRSLKLFVYNVRKNPLERFLYTTQPELQDTHPLKNYKSQKYRFDQIENRGFDVDHGDWMAKMDFTAIALPSLVWVVCQFAGACCFGYVVWLLHSDPHLLEKKRFMAAAGVILVSAFLLITNMHMVISETVFNRYAAGLYRAIHWLTKNVLRKWIIVSVTCAVLWFVLYPLRYSDGISFAPFAESAYTHAPPNTCCSTHFGLLGKDYVNAEEGRCSCSSVLPP
jgi:hypothetical protein